VLVQLAGIVPDPAAAVSSLRSASSDAITGDLALRSPFVQLASSVDEVCDRIDALRERHGISYITVFDGRSTGFDDVVKRMAKG
jgi:hypothetical protein